MRGVVVTMLMSMACATCRKLIGPGARYVRCSVASCNTGRQKLRFCTRRCWEAHVPTARHRNATFVEEGGTGDVAAAVPPPSRSP